MPKPNFFIVGAPKCGTTTLAYWLSQHPDVFFAPQKELNFWNTDHRLPGRLSLEEYEAVFASADQKAIGEGSVWYLYSRDAVPRILEYNPEARFIVCFRDQADMAISLHRQQVLNGNERLTNFRAAWEAGPDRPTNRCDERSQLDYKAICRVGEQIERLLKITDAVQFVHLKEMKNQPQDVFDAVLDFLDLDHAPVSLDAKNAASVRRSPILHQAMRLAGKAKRTAGINRSFGVLNKLRELNTTPAR